MNGGSEAGVSEEQDQVYRMNLQGCVGGLGDLRYLAVPTCPHCKQVVREGELSRPYSGVLVHELEEFNRRHGVGGYIHRNCSEPKDTGNG